MKEFRCVKCGKLLGKIDGNAEIKCPRCSTINTARESVNREGERTPKNANFNAQRRG